MTRRITDQVVVITGAASGIGRESALAFGRQGASVVLADHNERGIQEAAREIERLGGQAHAVRMDVGVWEDVQRLAREAVDRFGRIDTWVNNAAVSIYATVEQLAIEEIDRVVQVNLLGQIYGMKAALAQMKRQGQGTIINVASALAMRSVPLQSVYCATKHGIKGFTEALQLELKQERSDIAVTLIMPSSINTPLFEHARSKLGVKPMPVPPVYEPRIVAETILFVAEHPQREVVVGGWGKLLTVMQRISPSLLDWYMLRKGKMIKSQKTSQPDDGRDNLFAPMEGAGSTTGSFGQRSKTTSLYTRLLEQYPGRKRALLAAGAAGFVTLLRRVGQERSEGTFAR